MRGEARHIERAGTVQETRIVWDHPLVGSERRELEKKLEDMGVRLFRTPKDDPPCRPDGR